MRLYRIVLFLLCAAVVAPANAQPLPDDAWQRAFDGGQECRAAMKRETDQSFRLGHGKMVCDSIARQWTNTTRIEHGQAIADLYAPLIQASYLSRAGGHYLRSRPTNKRQGPAYVQEKALGCSTLKEAYALITSKGPAAPYSAKGGVLSSSTVSEIIRTLSRCGEREKTMANRLRSAPFQTQIDAIQKRCTRGDQSDPAIVGICANSIIDIANFENQQGSMNALDRNKFKVATLITMGTLLRGIETFRDEATLCMAAASLKVGISEVSLPVDTFQQMMVPISIKRQEELAQRCR